MDIICNNEYGVVRTSIIMEQLDRCGQPQTVDQQRGHWRSVSQEVIRGQQIYQAEVNSRLAEVNQYDLVPQRATSVFPGNSIVL